jgi:hypothetical protein
MTYTKDNTEPEALYAPELDDATRMQVNCAVQLVNDYLQALVSAGEATGKTNLSREDRLPAVFPGCITNTN